MTIFTSPGWVPRLQEIPGVSIPEFMLDPKYGRATGNVPAPFVCGISGKKYSFQEVKERVSLLSRALKKRLGIEVNSGGEADGFSQWEKVVCIYSPNCIDYTTAAWAVHLLNGVVSPANAVYVADELAFQLKDSDSRAIFTSAPGLEVALAAAKKVGISRDYIFILEVAPTLVDEKMRKEASAFKSLDDLVEEGRSLGEIELLKWSPGFSAKKLAFLCYSSGTSGLPKGVLISHKNVISNVLQISVFYSTYRDFTSYFPILAILPMSHIYSLVVINHMEVYKGSSAIVLAKFELDSYLQTLERYKIHLLYLVPPILINMVKNEALISKYDLSAARYIFIGAAPLSDDTSNEGARMFPHINITQAYGMTECSTVISMTSTNDIWHGSAGCIVPGVECKIVSPEDKELGEGEVGELVMSGPNITLGYLNNQKATDETFKDGWLRSGDEACFKRSKNGNYHLFIVDRLKDLVKVNGMQVAPAELEGHILSHPKVADCAVISVPDERTGELPKACVVVKPGVPRNEDTINEIIKYVADHKARHKHLGGGVKFLDAIPRTGSGKILRRNLRDEDKEERRRAGARL